MTEIVANSEDESELGPAMKALTPMQRRFVVAVQVMGSGKWSAAARTAGYSGDDHQLAVVGHMLSRNPKITRALVEIGGVTMQSLAVEAIAALKDVLETPAQAEGATKLKAATTILDRIGLGIKTEHTVNVNSRSENVTTMLVDIRAQISKNPEFRKMVPAPLLLLVDEAQAKAKKKEETVDAEFTEVVAAPDPDADLLGD